MTIADRQKLAEDWTAANADCEELQDELNGLNSRLENARNERNRLGMELGKHLGQNIRARTYLVDDGYTAVSTTYSPHGADYTNVSLIRLEPRK